MKTFLVLPEAQIEAIVIVILERKSVIIEKQAARHVPILHIEEILVRGEDHLEIIKEEKMTKKKMASIQWTHRHIPMLHEVK